MLPITDALLSSKRNRPFLRNNRKYKIPRASLKGVVAHWTANASQGADAMANRNYFNTTKRYASAHYIVDDRTIVRCIPDNEVAFHAGGSRFRAIGKHIAEGSRNPNYFLIGFEMCVNNGGNWDKTYQNSVELAAYLLNKHNLKIHQLYRHHDITGKDCPKMMIKEADWQKFREAVNELLLVPAKEVVQTAIINIDDLNVRTGNSTSYRVVGRLQMGARIQVYDQIGEWLRIGHQKWIHNDFVLRNFETKQGFVSVEAEALNVRSGPSTSYPILERLANGSEVRVRDQRGNWFQLEGERWVYKDYIRFRQETRGHVSSSFLSVRTGPGVSFTRIKRLSNGDIVSILEEEGVWYRIATNEWIHGNYVTIIR